MIHNSSTCGTPTQPIPKMTPATMPFSRASRKRMYAAASSVPQHNQIEVQGQAYLCFSQDFKTFQGTVNTSDESNYSIVGESTSKSSKVMSPFPTLPSSLPPYMNSVETTPNESENDDDDDYNNNLFNSRKSSSSSSSVCGDIQDEPSCFYNVTLTDHFTGLTHRLGEVELKTKKLLAFHHLLRTNNNIMSKAGQIFFKVENLYKGQKADLMIKQHIGLPSLLGKKCILYSGNIDILVNETLDWGVSWSL